MSGRGRARRPRGSCSHQMSRPRETHRCRVGRRDPAGYGKAVRSFKKARLSAAAHGQVSSRRKMSRRPRRTRMAATCSDPVAERLRLGLLEPAVEAGHLRPGDERPGEEAGGHPGEVLGEAREGQVL